MFLLIKYTGNSTSYEKQLDADLEKEYSTFMPRAQHPSYAEFQDETEQHQMMTNVIPLIFIIISMLTLLTTITRIINNQRTQIGVLKALGFKNSSIMVHYISYGVLDNICGEYFRFNFGIYHFASNNV